MRKVLSILVALLMVSVPVFGADVVGTDVAATPVVAVETAPAAAVVEKPGIHPLIGIDTEFVINKTLKLKDAGYDVDYAAQFYDLYTVIDFGGDLVSLKPFAGIQTFQSTVKETTVGNIDANGGLGFNMGLDAQINVVKTKIADLALIGGYRFSRTDLDTIDVAGKEISNPIETILYNNEWELGAKISKDLSEIESLKPYVGKSLTPYLGLVYSDSYGTINGNTDAILGYDMKDTLRPENKFGLRTGLAFKPTEDITLSIDAKFVDQTAIGASASYKF